MAYFRGLKSRLRRGMRMGLRRWLGRWLRMGLRKWLRRGLSRGLKESIKKMKKLNGCISVRELRKKSKERLKKIYAWRNGGGEREK